MNGKKRHFRDCPVETAMLVIGTKWKIFVLRELMTGTKRFSELLRAIDSISQKVLTQNLRAMEQDGLIARKVFAEVPPRVEYTLTELGATLEPVMAALGLWGVRYREALVAENGRDPSRFRSAASSGGGA